MDSLKLAMVRIFTPWEMANAAIRDLGFFSLLHPIFHYTTAISKSNTTYLVLERIIGKAGVTDHFFGDKILVILLWNFSATLFKITYQPLRWSWNYLIAKDTKYMQVRTGHEHGAARKGQPELRCFPSWHLWADAMRDTRLNHP